MFTKEMDDEEAHQDFRVLGGRVLEHLPESLPCRDRQSLGERRA
jgi:hypothetical protein